MRWLVADSLYCPEQLFCSHIESFNHYLDQAGETAWPWVINFNTAPDPSFEVDVLFALDRYDAVWPSVNAKVRIAQIAAVVPVMPWDVRKPDGSPAYDLVISSIPWMVQAARDAGCRAEYQALCFDSRALVCGINVKERDIPCLFVGSTGSNHQRRTALLKELGDVVTVMPPTFGRSYYELLARARIVLNCHSEWSRGFGNNLRQYEAMGLGAFLLTDALGEVPHGAAWTYGNALSILQSLEILADGAPRSLLEIGMGWTLTNATYVNRIPQLITWAKELLR